MIRKYFSNKIKNITVIGSGQMGTGIAYVAGKIGNYNVKWIDNNEKSLSNSRSFKEKLLDKDIKKNRITTEDKFKILDKFTYSTYLEDAKNSDLVIEAINEDIKLKSDIFKKLDEVCHKNCILASNTSSISITKISEFTNRPSQVLGMHFFNPVPILKLVEIIKSNHTSEETLNIAKLVSEKMNKTVVFSKDSPGFITNRILMPWINEAVWALHEKISSRDEIDIAMKLGTNVPMGPLTLADFIGLDTCLSILNIMHNDLNDDKFKPCPLLNEYVSKGFYGKKSGRGFYEYN